MHNHADKRPTTEVLSSLATEVARESLGNIVCSSASNSPAHKMFSSGPSSSLSYSLGHIGAGSNAAIAAAASQAIAATQQVSGLSLLPRNRSVVSVIAATQQVSGLCHCCCCHVIQVSISVLFKAGTLLALPQCSSSFAVHHFFNFTFKILCTATKANK